MLVAGLFCVLVGIYLFAIPSCGSRGAILSFVKSRRVPSLTLGSILRALDNNGASRLLDRNGG